MAATFYAQNLELLRDFVENVQPGENEGEDDASPYESWYLGTVFALTPSGKYYTPWARSNVTDTEGARDERWYDALEQAANKLGGWIESGEGDPLDLYFCRRIEGEEEEERE
jgi:hypothetical protein